MEEKKRQAGRPQIYNGEITELAKKMEDRRRAGQEEKAPEPPVQAEKEAPAKTAEKTSAKTAAEAPAKADPEARKTWHRIPEKLIPSAKRKREQENLLKMRILGIILGVLIVALIFALIFEVGLGYGTKQTGNERMAAQNAAGQQEIVAEEQTDDLP